MVPVVDDYMPWQLLLAHSVLGLLCAALDVADVWLQHFANTSPQAATVPSAVVVGTGAARSLSHELSVTPAAPVGFAPQQRNTRAAFEIEPARRRRFVLAFNNNARWPARDSGKKTA
jgi:hypothetical protein